MRTTQHIHMVKSTETLIIQCLYFSCSISLPTCAYFLPIITGEEVQFLYLHI